MRHGSIAVLVAAGVAVIGGLVTSGAPPALADAGTTSTLVQAEAFTSQSGARTERTADAGGGDDVGWLANGDSLEYAGVDLGAGGAVRVAVRLASNNRSTGAVDLHAGSASGPLLASVGVAFTGGWQDWVSRTVTTTAAPAGRTRIVAVMRSGQPWDFVNLNWLRFDAPAAASTPMPMPSASSMPMPSSSASASATPMPSASSMPGMPGMAPPPGKWISVDPEAQEAATRAFFAMRPATITGDPVHVPEFHATCTVSHHAKDDPIVFPDLPGASHDHTFIGNTSTNAGSTLASLSAATTTCQPSADHSAYWIPTLYASGKPIDPVDVTVYYGSRLKDPSATQPFPAGFREITGDPRIQTDTPDHQGNHFWCAGLGGTVGRSADGTMPICGRNANLVRQITFADCWDGVHLDSPDHRSHVSDAVNGACPAAFPVPIPNVSYVIGYPEGLDVQHISLASGTTFSMHGDFFDAWDPAALAQRVRDCLDQGVKCTAQGGF